MKLLAAVVLGALAAPGAALASSLASIDAYANLHTAGVTVVVTGDTDNDAGVALEWRLATGTFRTGHPLVRVDATRFVGSVFDLAPATGYEVRVTLTDP